MRIPLKLDPTTHRCIIRDRTNMQDYFVELPEKNPHLYIYGVLRKLDQERDNAAFFRGLLELNLFGLQTDGCTISVDPAGQNLLLHITSPLEFLTPQLTINLLTNFIGTLRRVAAQVENLVVIHARERKEPRATGESPGKNKANDNTRMRVMRI
jgi:hypothetical protein